MPPFPLTKATFISQILLHFKESSFPDPVGLLYSELLPYKPGLSDGTSYTSCLVVSHVVFYNKQESVSSDSYGQLPCRKGSLWTWPPPHCGEVLDMHKDLEIANGA